MFETTTITVATKRLKGLATIDVIILVVTASGLGVDPK